MKLARFLLTILLSIPGIAFAQTPVATTPTATPPAANPFWLTGESLFIFAMVVLAVAILALIALISTMISLRDILLQDLVARKAKQGEEIEVKSFWAEFKSKLWKRVPIEKEEAILMDHEYDGIRELDNHLPPWWTWLFYITIAFGVVYVGVYHVFKAAPLQIEEYNAEIQLAADNLAVRQAELGASIDETNVELTSDAAELANGKTIFNTNCAPCHREDGGGSVGPNFADDYWIHGGNIKDLFKTIKFGVPEKGMISWQAILRPTDIRDVASYIKTFKGTNPPNPKAPQGDLYQEE